MTIVHTTCAREAATIQSVVEPEVAATAADDQNAEALFKQAKRREFRRRLSVAALVTVLLLGAGTGIFFAVAGSSAVSPKRGPATAGSSVTAAATKAISSATVTITRNTITSRGTVADGTGQIVTTTLGNRPLRMTIAGFSFGDSLPNSNTQAAYLKGLSQAQVSSTLVTSGRQRTIYRRLGNHFSVVCAPTCTRTTRPWFAYRLSRSQLPMTGQYDPSIISSGLRSVAGGPFLRVGMSLVAGTPTIEYRVSINPARWSSRAASELSAIFSVRSGSVASVRVVDLWLDDQGRLRRVETSSRGREGPAGTVTIPTTDVSTWTFSNFNRPVPVNTPGRNDVLFVKGPIKNVCSGSAMVSCQD